VPAFQEERDFVNELAVLLFRLKPGAGGAAAPDVVEQAGLVVELA